MDIMQLMQSTQSSQNAQITPMIPADPAEPFRDGAGDLCHTAASPLAFANLLGSEIAAAGTEIPEAAGEEAEPVETALETDGDHHAVALELLLALAWNDEVPERTIVKSPDIAAVAAAPVAKAAGTAPTLMGPLQQPPLPAMEAQDAPVQITTDREAPPPVKLETAEVADATLKAETCQVPPGMDKVARATAAPPPPADIVPEPAPAAVPVETAAAERTPQLQDLPPNEAPEGNKRMPWPGRETAVQGTAEITVERGPTPMPQGEETAGKAAGSAKTPGNAEAVGTAEAAETAEAAGKEDEAAPQDGGQGGEQRTAPSPIRDGDQAGSALNREVEAAFDLHAAVKGVAAKPGETPPPALSRTYLQIAQKIPEPLAEGETSFQMKLFPEGLGEVTVRLLCHGDRVSVEIIVGSAATQKLLEAQSTELRAALEAKSYEVTGLDVGSRDGHEANAFAQWRQRQENSRWTAANPGQDAPIPYGFEAAHPVFGGFDCRA